VFLAVQTAMAKGALVSLDRVDRIPPIDVPIRPEMLGEIGTRRVGGASRRVAYRVSLFDEKTQKQLNNRHADASTRLSAFSLMVRDGQRWMPEAAFSLFEQELAASQQKSREALLAAIGDKPAADVVTARSDKVARELRELAKQAGVSTTPPDSLLRDVLDDLKQRLETHLGKGAAPGIVRIEASLSAREDAHYSPWGTVQTFLASAARLPREVMSDPFRMRGLVTEAEAFLRAFNLFGDPLVRRYLARESQLLVPSPVICRRAAKISGLTRQSHAMLASTRRKNAARNARPCGHWSVPADRNSAAPITASVVASETRPWSRSRCEIIRMPFPFSRNVRQPRRSAPTER